MIAGLFNNLAGVFKGFFSRAFWFASFMPVALTVALHLTVGALAFPDLFPAGQWLHAATTSNLAIFPLMAAGVVVLAYAMGPLAPVALGVLDGSRLPPFVQTLLRAKRVGMAYQARETVQQARLRVGEYESLLRTEVQRMIDARFAGMAVGAIGDPPGVSAAIAAVSEISRRMSKGKLPPPEDTRKAVNLMIAALSNNAAALPPGAPLRSLATKLTQAQGSLVVTLKRACLEATFLAGIEERRFGPLATLAPAMATRMAEARRAAEDYSLDAYGVEFDFIWPRLWLVMKDKDGGADTVSDAQAQVDFSVMSVCLIATAPIVWLPVLAATATSPWLFLAVASGGPLLCAFFYELAVASEWRLAQVVQATIDRYRLDLLGVLLQPKPSTRAAERRMWRAVQAREDAIDGADLVYRYAAS